MNITTKPKPFCFVLMPFAESFNDVYKLGIKGACEVVDVYCERVDEQIYLGPMLERIYNQIARADLLIADMTGKNPNVFYEVGYAHALGKPTILLTQDAADIPFDLKHFPHIVYGNSITDLKIQLVKKVKWLTEQHRERSEYHVDIEIYVNKQRLSSGEIVSEYGIDHLPNGTLTIHNTSMKTYEAGDVRIGLITPERFDGNRKGAVVTELPNGMNLHMLPDEPKLFPSAFASVSYVLNSRGSESDDEVPIIVRIFTAAGTRDFPLLLRRKKA